MVLENALRLAVASFMFAQEHHDKFTRDQVTRFERSILRGGWGRNICKGEAK